ncbi:hypothetical protein, partial [Evansella tamaricis]
VTPVFCRILEEEATKEPGIPSLLSHPRGGSDKTAVQLLSFVASLEEEATKQHGIPCLLSQPRGGSDKTAA